MDPVGFAASLITLVALSKQIWDILNQIKDLPQEARDLVQELLDLEKVLKQIQQLFGKSNCWIPSDDNPLSSATTKIAHELISIDAFNVQLLTAKKRTRLPMFLTGRGRKIAERLKKRLAFLRQELAIGLALTTTDGLFRVEFDTKQLLSLQLRNAQASQILDVSNKISRQEESLKGIVDSIQYNAAIIQTMFNTLRKEELTDTRTWGHVGTPPGITVNISLLGIQNRLRNICKPHCPCECHRIIKIRFPGSRSAVFGRLKISHSSSKQYCSVWECTSSTTLFNLAYVLPIWICKKALYVSFFHTYGPELLIAICNVLSYTSSVTIAVRSGDTQAIKHIFERRLACPKDIFGEGGTTILHYALIYKHLDMCRVLIECGADMFVPDSYGQSAYDLAWLFMMALDENSTYKKDLEEIFGNKDCFESKRSRPLHRSILRFQGAPSFENALQQASKQEIDYQDEDGMTTLHWASLRSDFRCVEDLLARGANVDIQDMCGWTALMTGIAWNKSPEIVQLLLKARAKPVPDRVGRTPLHMAAFCQVNTAILELLIKHFPESDLEVLTRHSETPVRLASFNNHITTVKLLLEKGATPFDQRGLWRPVFFGAHVEKTLPLFLDFGLDLRQIDKHGNTYLHAIAEFGSVQTLAFLHTFQLPYLDPRLQNKEGYSALDIAQTRQSSDPVFYKELKVLV